jgi:hypothetical protein
MSRTAKIKIHCILLKTFMMYGCRPWSMAENTQKRTILRKYKYGPVHEHGVCRTGAVQELGGMYKTSNLVAKDSSGRRM